MCLWEVKQFTQPQVSGVAGSGLLWCALDTATNHIALLLKATLCIVFIVKAVSYIEYIVKALSHMGYVGKTIPCVEYIAQLKEHKGRRRK